MNNIEKEASEFLKDYNYEVYSYSVDKSHYTFYCADLNIQANSPIIHAQLGESDNVYLTMTYNITTEIFITSKDMYLSNKMFKYNLSEFIDSIKKLNHNGN